MVKEKKYYLMGRIDGRRSDEGVKNHSKADYLNLFLNFLGVLGFVIILAVQLSAYDVKPFNQWIEQEDEVENPGYVLDSQLVDSPENVSEDYIHVRFVTPSHEEVVDGVVGRAIYPFDDGTYAKVYIESFRNKEEMYETCVHEVMHLWENDPDHDFINSHDYRTELPICDKIVSKVPSAYFGSNVTKQG